MTGFWMGGIEAHQKVLQQEFEGRIKILKEELKKCSSKDEHSKITQAIRDERTSYKRRLAELKRLLF